VYRGPAGGQAPDYDGRHNSPAGNQAGQPDYNRRSAASGYSPAPGYHPAQGYTPAPGYAPASGYAPVTTAAPRRPVNDDDEDIWNPPGKLFVNRGAPASPALAPAPAGIAAGSPAVRSAAPEIKSPPAANRPAPLFLSEPSAAAAGDGLFTPDLILSGKR
jgi:hypothetical protein